MPRNIRVTCWVVVLVLAGPLLFESSVTAQIGWPRATVMGGRRVRVTYPGMRRRVGSFVSMDRDTLVARWESGMVGRMAVARVTELDFSNGRFPQPTHGARVGAAIGLASGLILGIATGRVAYATAGCVSVGATVGSVVYTVRPRDTWRPWPGGTYPR